MTTTTRILTCPTSRCCFPRVQIFLHWSRSQKQRGDSCKMFTVFNQYQIRPSRHISSLKKRFKWLRRALLHQQVEVPAATHQCEVVAMQNLASALARNYEAHNYIEPMQVRQLEHEADARFSQRQSELLPRFSQEANQALENQREIVVAEVATEV